MKKAIALILSILFLFACASCEKEETPKGFDKETYEIALRGLEVVQQYNKAEITGETAKSLIKNICAKLENISYYETRSSRLSVIVCLQHFSFEITRNGDTFSDEKNLKKLLKIE